MHVNTNNTNKYIHNLKIITYQTSYIAIVKKRNFIHAGIVSTVLSASDRKSKLRNIKWR